MTTSAAAHGPVSARFASQLLGVGPARDVGTVVERICAVQAQDLSAARLAIRSRSRGLTAADVDQALTVDRTHGVSWLNRGTLHLVHRDDYPWLHALTAPTAIRGNARRLVQEGVAPGEAERAAALMVGWLGEQGPLTRGEIGRRLDNKGVRTQGQALVHLLMFASLRGLIVRGPVVGREQAFALVADWWGSPPEPDRDAALATLARRFLAGHAPADDRDLARWAGLPLRDVRRGLAAIAGETVADEHGRLRLRAVPVHEGVPPPTLLGGFDPVLMGWVDRAWVLGRASGIVTVNGLFRPFALVGGLARATWRRPGGEILLEPLAQEPEVQGALGPADRQALEAEAADIARFLSAPATP